MSKNAEDLNLFMRDALARGIPRDRIREVLIEAGWRPDQVEDALRSFADVDFAIPVPTPRATVSAKEAFLYLILFTTLYISAYSLGRLLFELVNAQIPDPAATREWSANAVRWAIARIVIAFPIYAYATYRIRRNMNDMPATRGSPIRRWMTNIAMFIAVVILVCDLVVLVYEFLDGALTLPLLLKLIVVGVIAGGILIYYFRELRLDESEFKTGHR
jgi:hypothetical protein